MGPNNLPYVTSIQTHKFLIFIICNYCIVTELIEQPPKPIGHCWFLVFYLLVLLG